MILQESKTAFRSYLLVLILLFSVWHSPKAQIKKIPEHYSTIQSAIEVANHGDTLLINEGRYYENINFKGKAITVASHFIMDGDTSHISGTIIDGGKPEYTDTASVVLMISGEDTTSVLNGLTITNGHGTLVSLQTVKNKVGGGILVFRSGGKIENCIVEKNLCDINQSDAVGGGIAGFVCKNRSMVIRNNVVKNNSIHSNHSVGGGGIAIGATRQARLIIIEGNRVINNSATSTGTIRAWGGGLEVNGLIPASSIFLVRDNEIAYNKVGSYSGALFNKSMGGGLFGLFHEEGHEAYDLNPDFNDDKPSLIISDNYIHHNFSEERGGGVAFYRYQTRNIEDPDCPQALLIRNRIVNNIAKDGVGVNNLDASIILVENIIRNELSGDSCGELFNDNVHYLFWNEGIINAHNNEIQGKWKNQRGIYYNDFPVVYTYAHSWQVKELTVEGVKLKRIPPFWLRWWAFVIYGIVLVQIFYMYSKYLIHRVNLKTRLKQEKLEKERIMKQDLMRSRFFANVSHEFRTPLTLISGPLKVILKEKKLTNEIRPDLELISNNAKRLQHLINQLLEISKIESGAAKLQVSKGNLSEYVKRIVLSFLSLAESRNIQYNYNINEQPDELYFDGEKIEKILNNLISNAFKFTPDGEQINVSLDRPEPLNNGKDQYITLTISDAGQGMTEKQQEKIFDRFHRADSTHKKDNEGSGIGLSLVKELVDLYKGEISVKSEPGVGSEFKVTLPAGKALFKKEELSNEVLIETGNEYIMEDTGSEADQPALSGIVEEQDTINEAPVVILVAEDNSELRKFISRQLNTDYNILEAENGRIAMDKAIESVPDLIISDLMMPEVDGAELLEKLRNDERTSHIPFIILTARADIETKLKCYDKGTDAYIEKPFNADILKARAGNLIRQRIKLKKQYRKEFLLDPENFIPDTGHIGFIEKANEVINKNLPDPDFNVGKLSEELSLSRSQLLRKVSALTGFSPVDYIRNTRLKAAAAMLKNGDLNVSQVMYEVGFSTPSYFTDCFKELFSSTPSDYRKKHL